MPLVQIATMFCFLFLLDFSVSLTENNLQNTGKTEVRGTGGGVRRQVFVSHSQRVVLKIHTGRPCCVLVVATRQNWKIAEWIGLA
jgi:hypothetical protein